MVKLSKAKSKAKKKKATQEQTSVKLAQKKKEATIVALLGLPKTTKLTVATMQAYIDAENISLPKIRGQNPQPPHYPVEPKLGIYIYSTTIGFCEGC